MSSLRAVGWLLRDVTLPYLRRHRLRLCLTLVGVAIGAQVVVAIQLLNRSVIASFAHTIETIAGGAQLQLTNASAGVPEDLVAPLAAAPGVQAAAALVQGTVGTPFGDLAVFGVDLFGDERVRAAQFPRDHVHVEDEIVFANARDSIAVAGTFLGRAGLERGARLPVVAPSGPATLVVRGEIDPVGAAALFGGAVAVVDLPVAQALFGREGRVDQIDLKLEPGADAAAVAARLAPLARGTGELRRPIERASGLEAMLASLQTFFSLTSLEAVIVAVFLIYNALRTAILHRRRELAIARAIGYRRRVLAAAAMVEAVAVGVLGALLGAVLGVATARVALDAVGGALGAIYGAAGEPLLVLSAADLLLAIGLGAVVGAFAALGPAREAARVPAVAALRWAPEVGAEAASRPAPYRALLATLAGFALYAAPVRSDNPHLQVAVFATASACLALGFAAWIPSALRAASLALRGVAARFGRVEPLLAVESVATEAERARGTVAAIMVAFALVLMTSALVRSLRGSIMEWIDQTLAADLYVTPTPEMPIPGGDTLPEDLAEALRRVPGVEEAASSRLSYADLGGRPIVLRSLSAAVAFDRLRYSLLATSGADYRQAFAAGAGALISDNLAERAGLRTGDSIALRTPGGVRTFRVVAIVRDFTLDIGTVIVDQDVYRAAWGDPLTSLFYLWLAPGARTEDVRAAIRAELGGKLRYSVLTSGEFKRGVAEALDNAMLLTDAIEIVAVAIAAIGVANFFLVAVSDRRRQIGLLRAVALSRLQVERVLLGEALLVGGIGGVLAIVYALPVSFFVVTRSARMVSGWTLELRFPLPLAAATVALAALIAPLAASWPVRRAAGEPIADQVGFE